MPIKQFSELIQLSNEKPIKKIAVAAAEDEATLLAIHEASKAKLIEATLIGNIDFIEEFFAKNNIEITDYELIDRDDPIESCKIAIELTANNRADILMKGKIGAGDFINQLLANKKIVDKDSFISHIALFGLPSYHKLIAVTDAAVNISPDINAKIKIIENAVGLFHKLKYHKPKVALLASVEYEDHNIPATLDAHKLKTMNENKEIKKCNIHGPMALDIAISKTAASSKGVKGKVTGNADILLVPDINSGNILYKALNFLAGATSASLLMGLDVPIILPSRADNYISKLMSVYLSLVIVK